jgi:hypothetical protein
MDHHTLNHCYSDPSNDNDAIEAHLESFIQPACEIALAIVDNASAML